MAFTSVTHAALDQQVDICAGAVGVVSAVMHSNSLVAACSLHGLRQPPAKVVIVTEPLSAIK